MIASTTTSTDCETLDSPPNLRNQLLQRLSMREQMEQLTGVLGWLGLSRHAKASAANREAEDRSARRVFDKTGGSDSTDRDLGKDDMSDQIVLGGIHQPQPPAVITTYPPKEGLGPLASALMAMAIPAAGAAGYIYQQEQKSEPVVAQPAEDESVRIRLGSINNVEED
jgi:hypothetical protein